MVESKMRSKTRKSAAGIALAAMVLVLSACGGSTLSGASGDPPGDNKPLRGLAAPLFSKGGSSAQGKITIYQKDDRWQLSVTIFSLSPGASYRLAFFDNGNCSSPNAFSAGKLWSPPDMPEGIRPDKWIPLLHADTLGNLDAVTRLPNPGRHNEEVFRKRSVLVFVGDTVRELAPGVSNEVAACGVFDTIQTLL